VSSTIVVAGLFSPWVDLDHLEVRGLAGRPADAVREASGVDAGTAMFAVRPSEVRRRVEAIPWVAHADVDTHWPDTVTVTVTPHRPVAVLESPEAVLESPEAVLESPEAGRVLTTAGAVLDPDELGPLGPFAVDLPRVSIDSGYIDSNGLDAGAAVARSVLTQLRPITANAVDLIHLGPSGTVTLGVRVPGGDSRAELVLGGTEDLPAKAVALDSVLSGTVELGCLERVDVSVPTRVTIQRVGGCTIQASDEVA